MLYKFVGKYGCVYFDLGFKLDIMTNSQVMDTLHCQSRTKVKVVKWC